MPSLRSSHRLLLVAAVLFTASVTRAWAGAKFAGTTGYEIIKDNTEVVMTAGAIVNNSGENATGTLMVKLWALDSP